MLTNFNSIKVRLEPLFSLGRDTLTEFQFHKGTIRTSSFLVSSRNLTHFNSIKVRLEHQFPQKMSTDCLFQFHKGTIRTNATDVNTFAEKFQFHKGTIRTGVRLCSTDWLCHISIP